MAKIFYCGGSSGRLGVLRAVMPFSELTPLLSKETLDYVGQSFPELNHDHSARTVIEIGRGEEDARWKVGFYLSEKAPPQFEESLRAFFTAASNPI
jgi:hypothetical protein